MHDRQAQALLEDRHCFNVQVLLYLRVGTIWHVGTFKEVFGIESNVIQKSVNYTLKLK